MTTNETRIEIFSVEDGKDVLLKDYRKYDHLPIIPRPRDAGWWCLHCGVHNPDSNSDTCINGCM